MPQMRALVKAINRRRKEQVEMLGGSVKETASKSDKQVDLTSVIEMRLKTLRAQTGKKTFDLREVI